MHRIWHKRMAAAIMVSALVLARESRAEELALVVFESQGGPMAPGDVVKGDSPLTLDAGQILTLIAEDGSVITLTGPFSGPPRPTAAANSGALSATLTQLLAASASSTSSLGASRKLVPTGAPAPVSAGLSRGGSIGGVADAIPPEPWLLDTQTSGHRCVLDSGAVTFWRSEPSQGAEVKVSFAGENWTASTRWPGGYTRLAAPEGMPRRNGAVYTLDYAHNPVTLTLHVLPSKISSVPVLAAWMVEKGCSGQATALLRGQQK